MWVAQSTLFPVLTNGQSIASFIASAAITILCILGAYFFDTFDLKLPTNAADDAIRTRVGSTSKAALKQKRSEILASFILAMSDQQLISGMAILIVMYAKTCQISVYTFQVATALAWLSWTTHLATLVILDRYFRNHRFALCVRMILLFVFFLLLQASFIIVFVKLAGSPTYLRFACVCSGSFFGVSTRFSPLFTVFSILNLVIMLVWMYDAYIQTLTKLLSRSYNSNPESTSPSGGHGANNTQSNRHTWLEALRLILQSFCIHIISVLFSFSFGIAMLAWFRNRPAETLPKPASVIHQMSPGQIFPLLLLLLPVLAATTAWDGEFLYLCSPLESRLS